MALWLGEVFSGLHLSCSLFMSFSQIVWWIKVSTAQGKAVLQINVRPVQWSGSMLDC